MDFNELKKIVDTFGGWLTENEAALLWNLARSCTGKGVILEIGSFKGKSTSYIGHGSKAGAGVKVYTVDPHAGYANIGQGSTWEDFKKNIAAAGVNDIVVPIVGVSEEVVKTFTEPIEFCFIDGDHDYEPAKLDFNLWFPKIIDGGMIAFHDSVYPRHIGVVKVVNQFVFKSKFCKNASFIDSITFAQKVSHTTVLDRLRNRYMLFLKKWYCRKSRLLLPKFLRTLARIVVEQLKPH
ncbi:MAG: class I SAM-dependent methyltransferase [Chitinivibrionales bacterium]|nr:class I SAM-dependent methyltransferase [Chitinivibrionales bacterium]